MIWQRCRHSGECSEHYCIGSAETCLNSIGLLSKLFFRSCQCRPQEDNDRRQNLRSLEDNTNRGANSEGERSSTMPKDRHSRSASLTVEKPRAVHGVRTGEGGVFAEEVYALKETMSIEDCLIDSLYDVARCFYDPIGPEIKNEARSVPP